MPEKFWKVAPPMMITDVVARLVECDCWQFSRPGSEAIHPLFRHSGEMKMIGSVETERLIMEWHTADCAQYRAVEMAKNA